MKKNIITIDLDNFPGALISKEAAINAQVPTPCTLSDAVEEYDHIRVPTIGIIYKKDVESFKENHLYKEEVLEDAVYQTDNTG